MDDVESNFSEFTTVVALDVGGRSKWVSNGRRFVFFSGRTRPVCSVFALVLVKLMRGMIRSIRDCHVSRHLW